MSDEVRAIVQWLRERARTAQQQACMKAWSVNGSEGDKSHQPPYCPEAEWASKFADEIERPLDRDALDILRSKVVSLQGVTIVPPRRRGAWRDRKR